MKQYLHALFKSPDESHECDKIEVVQPNGSDDDFSPQDYSSVSLLCDQLCSSKLFWGVRTLRFSQFPERMQINTLVNIPSLQIGGLCQDDAICQHSNPSKEGERIMDQLRQIFRHFLHLPVWHSENELEEIGIEKVISSLRAGLDQARNQNWFVGCGAGRTRSGISALALKLLISIALLIIAAMSESETEVSSALSELEKLAADNQTVYLAGLRETLDKAMESRIASTPVPGEHQRTGPFKIDRHDRFYSAVQCFSLGHVSYADGIKVLPSLPSRTQETQQQTPIEPEAATSMLPIASAVDVTETNGNGSNNADNNDTGYDDDGSDGDDDREDDDDQPLIDQRLIRFECYSSHSCVCICARLCACE